MFLCKTTEDISVWCSLLSCCVHFFLHLPVTLNLMLPLFPQLVQEIWVGLCPSHADTGVSMWFRPKPRAVAWVISIGVGCGTIRSNQSQSQCFLVKEPSFTRVTYRQDRGLELLSAILPLLRTKTMWGAKKEALKDAKKESTASMVWALRLTHIWSQVFPWIRSYLTP